jgi:hypothetical protein
MGLLVASARELGMDQSAAPQKLFITPYMRNGAAKVQFKLWEFGAAINQGTKWERLSPS